MLIDQSAYQPGPNSTFAAGYLLFHLVDTREDFERASNHQMARPHCWVLVAQDSCELSIHLLYFQIPVSLPGTRHWKSRDSEKPAVVNLPVTLSSTPTDPKEPCPQSPGRILAVCQGRYAAAALICCRCHTSTGLLRQPLKNPARPRFRLFRIIRDSSVQRQWWYTVDTDRVVRPPRFHLVR